MDFIDNVKKLAERISNLKELILTEEATKNAFIMPFIQMLGYDVFNPLEVVPEMDCDLTNRGDKIDYAINIEGNISILIECKHWKQNLNVHETQLKKYFAASSARFAILTNGIDYNFYTDVDKANIMDDKPFFTINMLRLKDNDIQYLEKFCKSNYNDNNIIHTASCLKTKAQINDIVSRELRNPSAEFVRYFVREINGMSNQKLIDIYSPLVMESINSFMSSKFNTIDNGIEVDKQQENTDETISDEKLKSFEMVSEILHKSLEPVEIYYKDYKSYFVIRYKYSDWRWICRLSLKPYSKRICLPYDDYKSNKWYDLKSIDNILDLSNGLLEAYKMASKE